jgi:hypothetical protein
MDEVAISSDTTHAGHGSGATVTPGTGTGIAMTEHPTATSNYFDAGMMIERAKTLSVDNEIEDVDAMEGEVDSSSILRRSRLHRYGCPGPYFWTV